MDKFFKMSPFCSAKIGRLVLAIGLAFFTSIFFACSGGSGGSSGSDGTGTLSLSLMDAVSHEYRAVYVSIDEVQVHMGGQEGDDSNWKTVASPFPKKTFNILELAYGVREELGVSQLPAGQYTQMRLIIGKQADEGINILNESHPYANYIIDFDDNYQNLKIPSGFQTGIKLVHGFEINANETTELLLDFDASKSVVQAGKSGQWILKPTIKVLDDTLENSLISGLITNGDGEPIEGALVSLQTLNPGEENKKDQLVIQASSFTNSQGEYTIFVEPGTYNLVAYKTEFQPACAEIIAEAGVASMIPDLILDSATTGLVKGNVEINLSNPELYVTLSFRESIVCENGLPNNEIVVLSLNVANNSEYEVTLPFGSYTLVAWTYDKQNDKYEILSIEVVVDSTVINIPPIQFIL